MRCEVMRFWRLVIVYEFIYYLCLLLQITNTITNCQYCATKIITVFVIIIVVVANVVIILVFYLVSIKA